MSRFPVGKPAVKDFFYGRREFLDSVRSHPWTWVCGQRRIGKSSILGQLIVDAPQQDRVPLHLDLSFIREREASGEALFARVFKRNARKQLQPLGVEKELFSGLEPAECFRELVHQISKRGKKVIFLWDEAERLINVERNDPGFLDTLRGYLQSADSVAFVLGASQLLSNLYGMGGHVSSFLGAFRWQPVGPLSPEESEALLRAEQTGGWSPPLDAELLTGASRWSGGHPRVLQELGALIEEHSASDGYPTLARLQDLLMGNLGLQRIIEDDFSKLTPLEQDILGVVCRQRSGVTVAQLPDHTGKGLREIRRAVGQLAHYGYVRFDGQVVLNYEFYRDMLPDLGSVADPEKVARMSHLPPPRPGDSEESAEPRETAVAGVTHDADIEAVMSKPEVRQLLEGHPQLEERFLQAAQYLCSMEHVQSPDECAQALVDFAGALKDSRLKVFVSYKLSEARTAKTVIKKLRAFSRGQFEFLFSEEYQAGDPWRNQLRRDLEAAHWFLLLLPDPSEDWDWCLWETGYFQGTMQPGQRLICIHHDRVERPDQIAEFQTVSATPEKMAEFLRDVFLKPNAIPGLPPINEYISSEIDRLALDICEAIRPPLVKTITLVPCIRLYVEAPEDLTVEGLERAVISEPSDTVAPIFGFIDMPERFGELVRRICESNTPADWLDELARSIRAAARKESGPPVAASFEAMLGGKSYRPIVHAIDIDAQKSIRSFQISFVEDVAIGLTEHAPPELRVLVTALRLAYRFRWEILQVYLGHKLNSSEFKNLTGKLEALETEATRRGVMDPEALRREFEGEARQRLDRQYAYWAELRKPDGSGSLDRVLAKEDNDGLQVMLTELAEMNGWFLKASSRLFAERIAALPEPDSAQERDK